MSKWKIGFAVGALAAVAVVPLAANATSAGSVTVPFAGNQLDAIASKAAKKCETAADWVYQDVKGDLPKPTPAVSRPSCPKPTKSPTPSATPSVTPSTSPTPTSSASSSAPTPTSSPSSGVPASVLDLSNWKVTLPVDKNGRASSSCTPLEVTQPALASFTDQWFHTTGAGDGVVFRANIEGCTTSNSGYPRSELREMNGSALASWSTTSGTSTMSLTEAITHLPVAKPQVVFAQVHGPSDDVGFAEATGTTAGFASLDFNHNGTSWGTLDSAYELGTRFNLKVAAAAGFIDVYYNGVLKVHHQVAAAGCYFKAGDYTQSNIAKGHDAPGAYGEVVIYALAVTHATS